MNIDLAINLLRGVRDRNWASDPAYAKALHKQIEHIKQLNAVQPPAPAHTHVREEAMRHDAETPFTRQALPDRAKRA